MQSSFMLHCGFCDHDTLDDSWVEEFHSLQQGNTPFIKQAAFNDPFNTILTNSLNKFICIPAGCHIFKAHDEQ